MKETIFDQPGALEMLRVRKEHIDTLPLTFENRRLVDIGCGVGHFTKYFIERGAAVTAIDARGENIYELRQRLGFPSAPNLTSMVRDVTVDPVPSRDVVFCYGLLYHTTDPVGVLERLASATQRLLLLETMVTDSERIVSFFVEEDNKQADQSLKSYGCRPSVGMIREVLAKGGLTVSIPEPQPLHEEFQWTATGNMSYGENGHSLRRVFIARRD